MYLDHFKLTDLPFRLSPDPQFLFLSKNHARAKAYMESTIWFTDGFVVITGEIGAGKTTVIESFLRDLGPDTLVAQVNQTQLNSTDFLKIVLSQFGFKPFKMRKAELLATINNFLIEQYSAGRKVVLVIDEAQNLSTKVLEEVRMLSGIETTKDKTLRIILAGQPELNDKLDSPEHIQLVQRVRLRFHLTALTPDECMDYIRHRLSVAGAGERALFSDEALAAVHRYTGGIPRLINTLCDTALLAAFSMDKLQVDGAAMKAAISELQWVEHSAKTGSLPLLEGVMAEPVTHPVVGRVYLSTEGRTIADRTVGLGRLIIGRIAQNDLQVDSKFVSRHHCQIVATLKETVIEDLNSTNGMLFQGQPTKRHVLCDGDEIVIGRHTLTYVDERPREHLPASFDTPSEDTDDDTSSHGLMHPALLQLPGHA